MSHIKLHLAFSLIIPLSATSSADEIILVNGDILQGTQTEITDTHIIWNTDNFGALSIAIDQVLTVSGVPSSNTPAEVDQALPEEMALADIKGFLVNPLLEVQLYLATYPVVMMNAMSGV